MSTTTVSELATISTNSAYIYITNETVQTLTTYTIPVKQPLYLQST